MLSHYLRVGKCFGLHALILKQEAGVEVDISAPSLVIGSRKIDALRGSDAWPEVARREGNELVFDDGPECTFDLVLVETLVGRGDHGRLVGLHCGTVVEPGQMIDIDQGTGVRIRAYRAVGRQVVSPSLRGRVVGIYRARELAERAEAA